ncbi:rare lipoprotein A [Angulomicrobium tetraedrale]|uniref:Endolytic peptidoglycan transglycosylase RlpA n=1 Tax=Ancylobacter tetraedralis TaxID=217068 RepID=A0A839Z989_9HYPH|nr:septal ring lytic transglycosylase RlpA family protein [Ancylobacter tetraedralis]MBB3771318.1 rare lipoprotein A [Ancylobacter tetraedralis]
MGTKPALVRANGVPARQPFTGLSRIAFVFGIGLVVANCTGGEKLSSSSNIDPRLGVAASPRVIAAGQPIPKGGGVYMVGKPYVVAGKTYVPQEPKNYKAEGLASWYGDNFHGRLTANGEVYDMHSIAAAHPTLPLPSYVRVTNLENGRAMTVRVNDRGPYHKNRLIDVSGRAADMLGIKGPGTAKVRVEYMGRAPIEGSDDIQLASSLRLNGAPAPNIMLASAAPVPVRSSAPAPSAPALADVPLPPSRPYDLGETQVAAASLEPAEMAPLQMAPARVAAAPVRQAAPVAMAAPARTAPKPNMQVASAQPVAQRPVQAQMQTPARRVASADQAPTGWVVGAQPVLGYAAEGVATPVDTGRGLY